MSENDNSYRGFELVIQTGMFTVIGTAYFPNGRKLVGSEVHGQFKEHVVPKLKKKIDRYLFFNSPPTAEAQDQRTAVPD